SGDDAFDGGGVTGQAITHTFRLAEAPLLKAALASPAGVLALIVSAPFFDGVVRRNRAVDPATYREARIEIKETVTPGWICLPDRHPRPAGRPGGPSPVPRQLRMPPRAFTGRTGELAKLDEAAATVVAITGAGGIGKTSLALHWAQRNLGRFPDGQLQVDLRGFDPDDHALSTGVVIRDFLSALDV